MKKKCKNCKRLRRKIEMLEKLEEIANICEWDLDLTYQDILNGTENGNKGEGLEPDKKFARWFAKRYGINKEH